MAQRWYVLHVYANFEKKVKDAILERALKEKLDQQITEVIVPSEEVIEMRRGAKVSTEKKLLPGYVLVRMELNERTWHSITSLPKVTGFLGSKDRPLPISDAEAERTKAQASSDTKVRVRSTITFEIGEQVRVVDGPFSSFNGLVEDVDEEKARLKVSVSIFGRATPVDLDFSQVEKM
jgi:transcription termination/antitermination protein NusG